jgi:hypothetical protein
VLFESFETFVLFRLKGLRYKRAKGLAIVTIFAGRYILSLFIMTYFLVA